MLKEEFITRAKNVHGDKYDYSMLPDSFSTIEKVKIICPEHGIFEQQAESHYNGCGCPACCGLRKLNTKEFIRRAHEVHGEKYDYSKTKYINKRTKVLITCPIHGDFWQNPHNHISQKQGCPECGKKVAAERINVSNNARKTKEEVQRDIDHIFGKGMYTIVGEYVNNKTKISVYCHRTNKEGKEHGLFEVRGDMLMQGHGCPKCSCTYSKSENELAQYIKEIYNGSIVFHDRKILEGKEIDIYIPELKIGIEYDGLLWHSEKFRDKNDILDKTNKCQKQGIRLIHIFEDEWLHKKEICKSRLSNILGLSKKIYARKCIIKQISFKDSSKFINENHLQGNVPSKINIALFYNDEIVAVMTFGNLRRNLGLHKTNGYFELLRFCNKKGYDIIGGASKLLMYFIKNFEPTEILSYADRRWSNGNLYEKIGFVKEGYTPQNYYYVPSNGGKRINRFNLRKDILVSQYNCPINVSETDFCKQMGFLKLYDCGNIKYVWKNGENTIKE